MHSLNKIFQINFRPKIGRNESIIREYAKHVFFIYPEVNMMLDIYIYVVFYSAFRYIGKERNINYQV